MGAAARPRCISILGPCDMSGDRLFSGMREDFFAAASAAAGMADFGADDFSDGLDLFLNCLDSETVLSDAGRDMTIGQIKCSLSAGCTPSKVGKLRPGRACNARFSRRWSLPALCAAGRQRCNKVLSLDPQFQGLEHWLTRAPQVRPPRESWGGKSGLPAGRRRGGCND